MSDDLISGKSSHYCIFAVTSAVVASADKAGDAQRDVEVEFEELDDEIEVEGSVLRNGTVL